jgi:hypothetical protein
VWNVYHKRNEKVITGNVEMKGRQIVSIDVACSKLPRQSFFCRHMSISHPSLATSPMHNVPTYSHHFLISSLAVLGVFTISGKDLLVGALDLRRAGDAAAGEDSGVLLDIDD